MAKLQCLSQEERKKMKEEIEKRRAEAAEKKKQKEETVKPAFSINTKGSSKVSFKGPTLYTLSDIWLASQTLVEQL